MTDKEQNYQKVQQGKMSLTEYIESIEVHDAQEVKVPMPKESRYLYSDGKGNPITAERIKNTVIDVFKKMKKDEKKTQRFYPPIEINSVARAIQFETAMRIHMFAEAQGRQPTQEECTLLRKKAEESISIRLNNKNQYGKEGI